MESLGQSPVENFGGSPVERKSFDVPPGSTHSATHIVEESDLSPAAANLEYLPSDVLAVWMESACLECAVASNVAGDSVWSEFCGVGSGLNMKLLKPIRIGTKLLITTTKREAVSRQIIFDVEAKDVEDPECVYATASHLRTYVPWDAMKAKVAMKNAQKQLVVGMKGISVNVVEKKHTGGANNVADEDGPVADCAGTASVVNFMEQAVTATVQGCMPQGKVLMSGEWAVDHLGPTPCGFSITTEAEIVEIENQKLTFSVIAHDRFEKIATAQVVAYLSDSSEF